MRGVVCLLLSVSFSASVALRAEETVFRVFRVETEVSDGSPEGALAPEYYIDGGVEAGLRSGMVLDAYRELRTAGDRALRVRFARVRVVEAYATVSVVRTVSVEPELVGPLFSPRAVMIGDVVGIAPATIEAARTPAVRFELGSAELDDAGEAAIEAALARLGAGRGRRLLVEGHACDLGGAEGNRSLSRKRADRVAEFLVAGPGLDPASIVVRARGEEDAGGVSGKDREMQRRVELRWLDE